LVVQKQRQWFHWRKVCPVDNYHDSLHFLSETNPDKKKIKNNRICRFSYLKKPKEQLYAVYQRTDNKMTKRKRTNNNLQHTALKTKDRATTKSGRTQVHQSK
jgi:hypothetical protein